MNGTTASRSGRSVVRPLVDHRPHTRSHRGQSGAMLVALNRSIRMRSAGAGAVGVQAHDAVRS